MVVSTLGNPKKRTISWSIDEFVTKAGPQYEERGFSEVEVQRSRHGLSGIQSIGR